MCFVCIRILFLNSHRFKIHRSPFWSQMSRLHLLRGFGTQRFETFSDYAKCSLHWLRLKCLHILAPKCLLLSLPYWKWYNSVQIIQSIIVFFCFCYFTDKSFKLFRQKKEILQHLGICFPFFFFWPLKTKCEWISCNYLSQNNGYLKSVGIRYLQYQYFYI